MSRRIAMEFADQQLLPPGEASTVDAFVEMWTTKVEPGYYAILNADTEPQVRVATAGYIEALASVQQQLFAGAMCHTG